MRTLRALGLASLLAGGLLIAYAAATGDVRVGLFLIVPFVYGTGFAPFLGMLLVMAGFVMISLSAFRPVPMGDWVGDDRTPDEAPRSMGGPGASDRRVKHGGVVLLGPIPIVWGSDRKIFPWMIGAGVVLLILALVLTWGPR